MKPLKWSALALLVGSVVGCGVPEGEEAESVELGEQQSEIARGTAVPNGTYPWAVSLHTGATPSTGNVRCSGSHIAPGWVLTAQHCFDSNLDGVISASEFSANEIWASLDRTRISDTSRGQVIQGAQVFLNNTNDLALLRLASPSSAPIVQLANTIPAVNAAVTPAGWGLVNNSGTVPDNLQQGQFRVTGSNALDLFYTNVNTEEMCGGDSGGPVFTQVGGVVQVVAAHTNSPAGCGVNTGNATGSRVDVALPWIRSIIPAAYGFVWADQPSTAAYTPSSYYSHNSTGGTNTITRTAVGSYRVEMPGLGQSNGNVQVTAYGGTANRCKVSSWGPSGTALHVYIACYTAAGAAADSYFVAQYYRAGAGNPQQGAYLWANQPSTASYTPSRYYSYNSRGGTNTVTRTGVGAYQANLPGFTTIGGNVQVTAYGYGSHHCKVASWGTNIVYVRCFDAAGNPADTYWTLRYTDRHVANSGQRGAYAWLSDATSPTSTPSSWYQWHSLGSTLTASRSGTGSYTMHIPGIAAYNRTSAMVTAYGYTNTYCNVSSWFSNSSGGTDVNVQCRDATGGPADSLFTMSYITNL
ncbi:trypsin-like serine protease [Pyxidicoccus fallax]|uniref:Trypsin-like serine protease n=1 Tax=Pyxidicoccus fallax TaxID=394095 RepID=A0A848LTU8_9BACT|nr:trypsin-like serine protease [Pyxidicoccus fallax]NMO20913.1 trypsin-like serine protease [Pyxidicoccus fallax]NPC82061.1 trypsin-like serine protease [Pyxidicoccus fallax]